MGESSIQETSAHCRERIAFKEQLELANAAFDSARARLQSRIGVSSQEEFKHLDREADQAWVALQRARLQLDRHIREHGCVE